MKRVKAILFEYKKSRQKPFKVSKYVYVTYLQVFKSLAKSVDCNLIPVLLALIYVLKTKVIVGKSFKYTKRFYEINNERTKIT